MNPHRAPGCSPRVLWHSLRRHRPLVLELTRREMRSRYQGSFGGLLWSIATPMLLLALYTFVFAVIFQARWPGQAQGSGHFALTLFAGLMLASLLCDVLGRAPDLIVRHSNYVKRVVFPLELLPLISALGVLLHVLLQLLVWCAALWWWSGALPWQVVWAPLMLLPLFVLALGLGWLFAGLGVFVRDLGQLTPMLATALLFLAPVFYPLSAVPDGLQSLLLANPLSFVIEQFRAVAMLGSTPDWLGWGVYSGIALLIAWLGFAVFQGLRTEMADVL